MSTTTTKRSNEKDHGASKRWFVQSKVSTRGHRIARRLVLVEEKTVTSSRFMYAPNRRGGFGKFRAELVEKMPGFPNNMDPHD